MAKPKIPEMEELIKKGLILYGNDERLQMKRLPSGIRPLDDILGGGFPYNRICLIVGPESTGKTAIAQYAAAAQQKIESRPHVLLVDTELSYDQEWWTASGVDTDSLMVCQPATAEKAIDVMRSCLEADDELGMIILDSIAAMTPSPMAERSAEQPTMGALAQAVSLMYHTLMPLLQNRAFIAINQLRDSLTGYEEVYPGGRAQKFDSHIILRTRRKEWIEENDQRIGFVMEVFCKKNKTAPAQGTCEVPFLFQSQIDFTSSYLDEAIEKGIIRHKGPYYYYGDPEQSFLGKQNLRQYFTDNPDAMEELKVALS